MTPLSRTVLRVALASLGLLMVPLVASQLVEGWNWKPRAFVLTYFLFFGTGLAYARIAGRMGAWTYKAAVALALLTGFVHGWSNMVHISESERPINFFYFSVLAIGAAGAWWTRLDARGLSRVLFAMAATLAILSVLLASAAPPGLEHRVALGHALSVGLFTLSAILFHRASLPAGPGAAPLGAGN